MPSPLKKSFAAEVLEKRQKKSSGTRLIAAAAVIIAVIAVGYALYMRYSAKEIPLETVAPPTEEVKSIAVLPFVNMSADPEQEYFCDGLADDIINALTHVKDLLVLSRTSSFAFKGQEKDIREIGRELEVDAVFEGSVSKSGNRLRIIAQLINVADGYHILSERYDREMEDVFEIRDDISLKIVDALKVKLLEKECEVIEKRYTNNLEAYDLYLMGKKHGSTQQAIDYYREAIEKDPNFALAYVSIAKVYISMAWGGGYPPHEMYSKARAAAEKALEIDPDLAEAHSALGEVSLAYYWDWIEAENRLKRAIMLNPGLSNTHYMYSMYFLLMGQYKRAVEEAEKAKELNPRYIWLYLHLMRLYSFLGQFDKAWEQYQEAQEINPNLHLNVAIFRFYWEQGKYKEVLEIIEKAEDYSGRLWATGMTYAYSGEKDKAEEILHEFIERKKEWYVSSATIAWMYCAMGDNDNYFKWLEMAYDEHDTFLPFIKSRVVDSIRSDPRYKAFLKKMGLPED